MDGDFQDQAVILACIVAAILGIFTLIAILFIMPVPRVRQKILLGVLLFHSVAYAILLVLKWLFYRDRQQNPTVYFVVNLVSALISLLEVLTHLEVLHAFSPLVPFWNWRNVQIGFCVEILAHFTLHFPSYVYPTLRPTSSDFYTKVLYPEVVATAWQATSQCPVFSDIRHHIVSPLVSHSSLQNQKRKKPRKTW
jgi:hypothetical protein